MATTETTRSTATLLLVDDDADIRETYGLALEDAGYEVIPASTGAEALDKLRGGARPDLIVLDQAMPLVNGREFRALQLSDPTLARVPVLLLTGAMKLQPLVDDLMPVAALQKPVGYTELLSAIRGALRKAQHERDRDH